MPITASFVSPTLFTLFGVKFNSFGTSMAATFATLFFILDAELKRTHLTADAESIASCAIIGGLVGSKLHFLFGWDFSLFTRSHWPTISELQSGMSWQGGAILATLVVYGYLKYHRQPFFPYADHCFPLLPLGYALGKIGCFLSGDGCYGPPTSLPWGMRFPNGLIPTRTPVHPTPLYEAALNLLCWFWLWKRRKARRVLGDQGSMGLILSGLTRLLAEPFRYHGHTGSSWGVLVRSQFAGIAFCMVLMGVVMRWWFLWSGLKRKVA